MLKDLVGKLKNYVKERIASDPSVFNDPVASKTEWSPAKGGGASFRTHSLIQVNPNRIEFKASIGARVFYMIFILAGLTTLIFMTIHGSSSENTTSEGNIWVPYLVGTVFTIAGSCMLYFGTSPIVFDKKRQFFWKGRQNPAVSLNRNRIKHYAKLDDIHALQIISEYCRSDKSSYYSYELNIVLKSGRRINVVDHGNLERIRKNGKTLSAFLNKPAWDATL